MILQKKMPHIILLLVEDDASVSSMYRRYLTAAGVRVVSACNGVEGLAMLKKEKVHCIVSDIQMPQMNGYEMLTHIKKDVQNCKIPIIVLTNLNNRLQDIKKIKELGIQEYLIKSNISLAELLKKIIFHTDKNKKNNAQEK